MFPAVARAAGARLFSRALAPHLQPAPTPFAENQVARRHSQLAQRFSARRAELVFSAGIRHGLDPAKVRLDPHPDLNPVPFATMLSRKAIDRVLPIYRVLDHLRRDGMLPACRHKAHGVLCLIGCQRSTLSFRTGRQPFQRSIVPSVTIRVRRANRDDQITTMFHKSMPHKANLRDRATTLAEQYRVSIAGRLMRVIVTPRAFESHYRVARAVATAA